MKAPRRMLALSLALLMAGAAPAAVQAATSPNFNSDDPFAVSSEISHYTGVPERSASSQTASRSTAAQPVPAAAETPSPAEEHTVPETAPDAAPEENPSAAEPTAPKSEQTEIPETEEPAVPEIVTDVRGEDTSVEQGDLVAKLKHAYYKNGNLVVETYYINGLKKPVVITGKQSLILTNADGETVKCSQTVRSEFTIQPGKYKIYTFTIKAGKYPENFSLEDPDLDVAICYAFDD